MLKQGDWVVLIKDDIIGDTNYTETCGLRIGEKYRVIINERCNYVSVHGYTTAFLAKCFRKIIIPKKIRVFGIVKWLEKNSTSKQAVVI